MGLGLNGQGEIFLNKLSTEEELFLENLTTEGNIEASLEGATIHN